MTERRPSAAGGFPIAVCALAGAGLGFLAGEATPGFLIGLAVGTALAAITWLRDRAR